MANVRVCAIGTGRAGMVHARNFRWFVPHAELVAIVDVNAESVAAAAAELDLEGRGFADLGAALAATDVDAVVITTPTFTHAALVREAAAHGLHVLCEKPMALSVAECDQMIADCERAKVTLQLAFMRRFDPPFVQAKAQLDAGAIGDVLMVRSLTRGPGLPPAWANDLKTSNGMLAEVNSHDFDAVRWLSGAEYAEVHVRAAARKRPDLRATLPDFYDVAVVSAVMTNGAFGIIDGVCPADYGYDARAEIVGSAGLLFAGDIERPGAQRVTREGGAVGPHYTSWRDRFAEAYRAEEAHFVESVQSGKAPSVGGRDGRAAVAAVVAANRSYLEGRAVAVED
jgi:myo-inositol 2-dehydrogenase/D-chiro-inositol 1-dehydrogenase/scyllo-inositol 2-dehydrogenase (NAD+)